MVKRSIVPVALVAVYAAIPGGCAKDNSGTFAGWPLGLHVTGQGTVRETAKAYTQVEKAEAIESKGFFNQGPLTGQSTGTNTTIKETTENDDWIVVGKTYLANPWVPGEPEFDVVPVFVVEAVNVENGVQTVEDHTVADKGNGQVQKTMTKVEQNLDRVTSASTYGLAGDEYVVKISDLKMLWDPNLVELWHQLRGMPGLEVLVKTNAGGTDFWVSTNGNTLHRVVGRERVDSINVVATKVELRETGNADTLGIIGSCLLALDDRDQAFSESQPAVPGFDHDEKIPTVHLDPGCEKEFLHHKVGWEWWYQNVLVKEQATYYYVKIKDYGWEWTAIVGGQSTRMTSKQKTKDAGGDARLFVEFTQTVKDRSYQATSWKKDDTPWGK